jgi:hypothetical protein
MSDNAGRQTDRQRSAQLRAYWTTRNTGMFIEKVCAIEMPFVIKHTRKHSELK